MAEASIPRWHGDEYQALIFWINACRLFHRESRCVIRVGYEIGPKGFDDVVVWYSPPIRDWDGSPVATEYHQVKFHSTDEGAFSWAALMEPAFINATSHSILNRLSEAATALGEAAAQSRFYLHAPWAIEPDDPLGTLIRLDRGGSLNMAALKEGNTNRSRMGKVRLGWMKHLGLSDEAGLVSLLRLLKIRARTPDLHALRQQLTSELLAAGLAPVDLARRTNPYPGLIQRLREEGRTEFDERDLLEACKGEGLWRGRPSATTEPDASMPPTGDLLQAGLLRGLEGEVRSQTALLLEIRDRLPAPSRAPAAPSDPEASGTAEGGDRVLAERIDEARDLINAGKLAAARELLLKIRDDTKDAPALEHLRFRIASNLGVCALDEESFSVARDEFDAALGLAPEDPQALANAALAAMLTEDLPRAEELIRRATVASPADSRVVSVLLQVLAKGRKEQELKALLSQQAWIQDDAACSGVLGWVACEMGDFARAETYLRRAREGRPDDARILQFLALSIVEPVNHSLSSASLVSWHLPEEVRERLAEADDLLSKAADWFRLRGIRAAASNMLVRRAHVRHLLGRSEDGIVDCGDALFLSPTNEAAYVERAIILLGAGRPKDALVDFRRIGAMSKRELALPVSAAFLAVGDAAEALALLSPLWPTPPGDPSQYAVLDLLLEALRRTNNLARAEELLHGLAAETLTDPDVLAIRARQAAHTQAPAEAERLFKQAVEHASGAARDRVLLELAEHYGAQREFGLAADSYAEAVDATRDSVPTRKFLISLFNAGRFDRALEVAQSLRGRGPALSVVSEIEALILEFCADTDGAKALWQGLQEAEPDKVSHRIRLAMNELRVGNETEARRVVEGLRTEMLSESAQDLLQVAQARHLLGMEGALAFAYEAWRRANNDPETHLAYIGLFLNRESAEAFEVADRVELNAAVRLRCGGAEEVLTLLAPGVSVRIPNERAADDPLTAMLLGRRRGERLVIREGLLRNTEVEVLELQNAYVAAFQRAIASFPGRFPEHPGIESFDVSEGDVTPVFAAVEAREGGVSQALSAYAGRQLTIGAFAQLSGRSILESWGYLMASPDRGVRASFGTLEDTAYEAAGLRTRPNLVLDTTALLSLGHLKLLEKVHAAFPTLLVPRPVRENLQSEIAKLARGPSTMETVGKQGGRYVFHHVTPESIDALMGFLRDLLAFVDNATTVVPMKLAAELGRDRFQAVAEALGHSAISAVLVAKEHNAFLCADDALLRYLAQKEYCVRGAWTQTIIESLRDSGVISSEEHIDAIRSLLRSNYRFVRLSREDFRAILRSEGYLLTEDVRAAFRVLEGPDCSIESAAQVLADLVRDIWVEVALPEQRLVLLEYVLTVLGSGRRATTALHLLRALLPSRFPLLPSQLREVLGALRQWQSRSDTGLQLL